VHRRCLLVVPVVVSTALAMALPSTAAAGQRLPGNPDRFGPASPYPAPPARHLPAPPFATASAALPRVIAVQQIAEQAVGPQPGSQPDTQTEPDIAVDPNDERYVVATFQQGRFADGASVDPGYAWSHDAGRIWHHGNLPKLTTAVGGAFDRASDPAVAFGPDGAVYISTLAFNTGNCINVIAVQRSDDHGATFGRPVLEQRTSTCSLFEDKNWITVDTNPGSPYYGRIYGPWTRFKYDDRGNEVSSRQVLRYSDDRGRTWSPLVYISGSRTHTEGAQPLVRPGGVLVDVYEQYTAAGNFEVAQTSRDGGRSFGPPHVISRQEGFGPPDIRDGELPSGTVDPRTGTLYVSWTDNRHRTDGQGDILLSRSNDGASWTRPVRVNSDPVNSRIDHFTPDVAAYGGHVYVSFRTRDNAHGLSQYVGFRLVESADGGRSFDRGQALGPATNLRYAARAPVAFLGDYMGLAVNGRSIYAAWCVASRPTGGGRYHQTTWGAALRR